MSPTKTSDTALMLEEIADLAAAHAAAMTSPERPTGNLVDDKVGQDFFRLAPPGEHLGGCRGRDRLVIDPKARSQEQEEIEIGMLHKTTNPQRFASFAERTGGGIALDRRLHAAKLPHPQVRPTKSIIAAVLLCSVKFQLTGCKVPFW